MLYYSEITNKPLNIKDLITKVYFLFISESDVALVAYYPADFQVVIQQLRLFPLYNSFLESFSSSCTGKRAWGKYTWTLLTTWGWKQHITSTHILIGHDPVTWCNITTRKVGKWSLPLYSRRRDGWASILPISALKV